MKGIMKTMEVLIGLSLVLLSFVGLFTSVDPLPEFETTSWKTTGLAVMKSLDASNQLRFEALSNDTASIENSIGAALPSNVETLVQVCGTNCSVPTIGGNRSTSAHYLISGDANDPNPREIVAYMWSND